MCTPTKPASATVGQQEEPRLIPKESSGGSAATEVREVAVKPTGPAGPVAVTTATPAAWRRKTDRKRAGSKAGLEPAPGPRSWAWSGSESMPVVAVTGRPSGRTGLRWAGRRRSATRTARAAVTAEVDVGACAQKGIQRHNVTVTIRDAPRQGPPAR